jgi:anti-sigma factor RsiW
MRLFRRHRDLVCRQAVDLMADYLDGRLDAHQVRRLEAHLAGCPHCTEYLAQLRVTIDALGHADPADLDDEALDDLVHLYRQWRADDQ